MADLRGALGAAGPVVAGVVGGVISNSAFAGERAAVGLRSGEDIVTLVIVGRSRDGLAFFSERGDYDEAAGDASAFGVVPGAGSDAVARANCGLAVGGLGTQAGMPGAIAGRTITSNGSGEASEIGAFAGTLAGDEELHGLLRLLGQDD